MPRRPRPRGAAKVVRTEAPPEVPRALAAPIRAPLEDDRPTEIYDPSQHRQLHASVDQEILGSTIEEMMRNPEHKLRRALLALMAEARRTLPGAKVDGGASLRLQHEFEFDRRVGYRLWLRVGDGEGRTAEVTAELDQDGRAIRRGSMIAKLITI